jgi:rare lipoprotein A
MRRIFSFGALALLLSGSTLAPAISEQALGATRESSVQDQDSSPELAIREVESAPALPELQVRPAPQPIAPVPTPAPRSVLIGTGQASWYGPGFFGNRTANGEVFRPGTMTAAHRTLPFGTRVRVTNLNNGRVAVVRINDRGPFHGNRVIDLGHGAAKELGVISSGLARVKLEVLR